MKRSPALPALFAIAALCAASAVLAQSGVTHELNIESGRLADSLRRLADQVNLQVVFYVDDTRELQAGALHGRYTPEQALTVLLKGSGLEFEYVDAKTISVRRREAASSIDGSSSVDAKGDTESGGGYSRGLRLSQNSQAAQRESEGEDEGGVADKNAHNDQQTSIKEDLEEVVVTGTHIRGMAPVGSQVRQFDREDIERSGASTTEQFLAFLPQQFGSVSADTVLDFSNAQDPGFATAVDLRGLGGGATLVLLNGRRMSANGNGSFVDISTIPLSAVERIEVLLDGASAIYGSDAVGGVVNIILRKDYRGAVASIRYGISAYDDGEEWQVSQLLGSEWASGGGLLNVEYGETKPAYSFERDFSSGTRHPNGTPQNLSLKGSSEKWSVRAAGHQSIRKNVEIMADAGISVHEPVVAIPSFVYRVSSPKTEYGYASASVQGDLSDSWKFDLTGQANRNLLTGRDVYREVGILEYRYNYSVRETSGQLMGQLFELPAGTTYAVVGGSVRFDKLDREKTFDNQALNEAGLAKDKVKSMYGEVSTPLLGDAKGAGLTASLAGRYDRYQQFGSAFTPKFGLEYRPTKGLSLRGNYNRSFRAPTLLNTNEYLNFYDVGEVTIDGNSLRSFRLAGNNRDLEPERAKSWSIGLDWQPEGEADMEFGVTYSRINYFGRIQVPAVKAFNQELTDPAFADILLLRSETTDAEFDALVRQLLGSGATILDLTDGTCSGEVDPGTGVCISEIDLIDDLRLTNIAAVDMRNLDLNASIGWPVGNGRLITALDGTYMFAFRQRITPRSLSQDFVGAPFNPPDYRINLRLAYEAGPLATDLFVRHTAGYPDTFNVPNVHVSSWTTIDMNLRYEFGGHPSPMLNGLSFSANISNLLNRDPPYWPYDVLNRGYDSANAEPIGRFVSLSLSKEF